MIDKILCISSDHQPYRRAAQITALQLAGYPIDIFEIVWANHRSDWTDVELIEMMASHGLKNYRYALDEPIDHAMRNYTISCMEGHVRALLEVVERDINAIILEDDILLVMDYRTLTSKFRNLLNVAPDAGVVLMTYDCNNVEERPFNIVKGAPDFVRGSLGLTQSAMFVTPFGASSLLESVSKLERPSNIEARIICEFSKYSWFYCVVHPNQMVTQSTLQGDSIAVLYTEQEQLMDRMKDRDGINRQRDLIDRYKLGGYKKDKPLKYGSGDE